MEQITMEIEPKTLTRPEGTHPEPLATAIDLAGARIAHYLPKEHPMPYHQGAIAVMLNDTDPKNQPLREHLGLSNMFDIDLSYDDAIKSLENEAGESELKLNRDIATQPRGMQFYTYPIEQKPIAAKVLNRMMKHGGTK